MRARKSETRRFMGWALVPLFLLAAPAAGCIVVEEDTCLEYDRVCTDDGYVEECISDDWVVIEDCVTLCGGDCVYVDAEPACLC